MMMLALALVLGSCKYEEGLKEKEVKGRFTISVTDYVRETDKLHPKGVFQYSSPYRTVYLLVLDTAKTGLTLAEYGQIATNQIATALADSSITPIDSITSINGANALQYELEGNITNERIWYKLAVVEGPEHYYQVLGWTIMQRKEKYGKDIGDMVGSFSIK